MSIITNCDIIDVNGKDAVYCGERQYTDENGIHITRLPYRSPKKIYRFFRRYSGLMQALCSASVPDVLFIHSCQFLDISVVVKYLKQHPGITVYVDNHADFYNSAQNFLSKKKYFTGSFGSAARKRSRPTQQCSTAFYLPEWTFCTRLTICLKSSANYW